MNIEYFTNDKYRVLDCMEKRQISIQNNNVIKLSQQEISDILKLSKMKINRIVAELKTDGYIVQNSPRGNYCLTDKAIALLNKMHSV